MNNQTEKKYTRKHFPFCIFQFAEVMGNFLTSRKKWSNVPGIFHQAQNKLIPCFQMNISFKIRKGVCMSERHTKNIFEHKRTNLVFPKKIQTFCPRYIISIITPTTFWLHILGFSNVGNSQYTNASHILLATLFHLNTITCRYRFHLRFWVYFINACY